MHHKRTDCIDRSLKAHADSSRFFTLFAEVQYFYVLVTEFVGQKRIIDVRKYGLNNFLGIFTAALWYVSSIFTADLLYVLSIFPAELFGVTS